MVGMASTFDNPTCNPLGHKRECFKGWKSTGNGFGKAGRDWMSDPSVPRTGRFAPKGLGMYRSAAFWHTKLEDSRIPSGFGFGDRPPGERFRSWSLDPATYGDVSPLVCRVKRDPKKNITLKPYFPDPCRASAAGTPGPKYDVAAKPGENLPKWSLGSRHPGGRTDSDNRPAPGDYETRRKAGKNHPLFFGTLHSITIQGRTPPPASKKKVPGPGTYSPPAFTDKYNVMPAGYTPFFMRQHKDSLTASAPQLSMPSPLNEMGETFEMDPAATM